jgi:predicted amidophosphoribosyltransferase
MEGWTEDEIRNKDLMAPCGLYCGACGVYIATRDKNEKFRQVMGNLYGTKPEDTVCLGCMQPEPPKEIYGYCRRCSIRNCVRSKGFYSCHQCTDWPCDMIENFSFATGRRVMKNSIPAWREKVSLLGDEKGSVEWARSVCERYHCPSCGKPLFRGAQHCRHCKSPVADDLDGSL